MPHRPVDFNIATSVAVYSGRRFLSVLFYEQPQMRTLPLSRFRGRASAIGAPHKSNISVLLRHRVLMQPQPIATVKLRTGGLTARVALHWSAR